MSKLANQEKAIAALIDSNTISEAAEKCGLSEKTLSRYLREPKFLAEFRSASKAIYEASMARVIKGTERARYALQKNLDCKQPAVEVRAAAIILEFARKGIETTEILERLEKLENELNSQQT